MSSSFDGENPMESMDNLPEPEYKCRERYSTAPGCICIEVTNDEAPLPVGSLWYRWNAGKVAELLHVYVLEEYRRQGVANMLLEYLKMRCHEEDYNTIINEAVNEYSEEWIKKNGFVYISKSDSWELFLF